jgi:AAA+ ATPase superfamily predicted ATPase
VADELAALSRAAAPVIAAEARDLNARPFVDWDDALETLALAARNRRLLLVLDELPALAETSPQLPSLIRAAWDRLRSKTKLKLLLCGSAVRVMEAMQEERAPLYGRMDLALLLHPFRPHEAARMLTSLSPSRRALVWGIVGGTPLYLRWWDQGASVGDNLLRLVERLVPVTEDPRRTRRRIYRIADNFLAFWLGLLDRYRPEIERGLGKSILPVLLESIDDQMGGPWENAFRDHLRRLAGTGGLLPDAVAVGPFWTAAADPGEIDAVVLAGRRREAVLIGEAKWGKRVDGARLRAELERKAQVLPRLADEPRYAICARERVDKAGDALVITAADIFAA